MAHEPQFIMATSGEFNRIGPGFGPALINGSVAGQSKPIFSACSLTLYDAIAKGNIRE